MKTKLNVIALSSTRSCLKFGKNGTKLPYNGKFQGRNHLRISRFCGYMQKFSPRNLGRGILWCCKSEQSAKVFSAKFGAWHPLVLQKRAICESFLHENCNLQNFSPSKVSCYTVYVHVTTFLTLHKRVQHGMYTNLKQLGADFTQPVL